MNYGSRTPLPKFKDKIKVEMSDELTSDDDKQGCKRKCRNASEKKRRDQFNCLIQELGCMVLTTNRKMDKSAVLRSTINFLKAHNENALKSETSIKEKWKPSFLSDNEFSQLMLEALDGFLIVFSQQGHILYTSSSITSLLRHLPKDIENCTIYELVHEDDRPKIFKILSEVERNSENEMELLSKRFTFQCQMRRGSLQPSDLIEYEMVKFHGNFTMINNQEGMVPLTTGLSKYCFIATVRLVTTQLSREMATFSEQQNKFMSRHSLDWKFLYLDHRGPPIIGHLPFEVLGTSVYDYYHQDDLENVAHCHEALIQTSEGISCYYRFLTKGQEWIWLQTRNYITYNQWNSKPEFIVCVHKVVNYAEVRNDANQSLNLMDDSRIAADKSDSGAGMDSHTSTSDTSASTSPVSSIDGDRYLKKHKQSKNMPESFHSVGNASAVCPLMQPSRPSVQSCPTSPTQGRSTQQQQPSCTPTQQPRPTQHTLSSISSQKSTCTDNSSHMFSDQEVLASSSSIVSAQIPSNFTPNQQQLQTPQQQQQQPQQQPVLAPELVLLQIKLQEQLVQRHQKLQDAIVQQQTELQAVQQQLLVAQQFLIQSNPFLQGLMPQSSQSDSQNPSTMPRPMAIAEGTTTDTDTAGAAAMAVATAAGVPQSLVQQETNTQVVVPFLPQMFQDRQQQQEHKDHQQQQQQQQQQQMLLTNQQLSYDTSPCQSSSAQQPTHFIMPQQHTRMEQYSSAPNLSMPCLTTPCLTTPCLTTPSLSANIIDSTSSMDSTQLSLPGLHREGSPSPLSQALPNSQSQKGSREPHPFDAVSQYQMQNLPSDMESMQHMMTPPHTQSGP